MKPLCLTYLLAAVLAGVVPGAEDTSTRTRAPAGEPTSASPVESARQPAPTSLLEPGTLDEITVPITPPAFVRAGQPRSPAALLAEGSPILDRVAGIEKDPGGEWWTIKDPRVERLRLLPCEWLEAVEQERAIFPEAAFRLSGEVYRYRGEYYLLLRKALRVEPPSGEDQPAPPAASEPAAPAERGSSTRPAGEKTATPEDIARELLRQKPDKPLAPVIGPTTPVAPAPSVVRPTRQPLAPGPGRVVMNRLTRLAPQDAAPWRLLVFESDNTLQEPPYRILPCQLLERMETLSEGGAVAGARFHVSGQRHRYHGQEYILLTSAIRRREMGQF